MDPEPGGGWSLDPPIQIPNLVIFIFDLFFVAGYWPAPKTKKNRGVKPLVWFSECVLSYTSNLILESDLISTPKKLIFIVKNQLLGLVF